MKYEEAKEMLSIPKNNKFFTERFLNACELAVVSLEKQIPRKPKFYDTKFRQRGRKYGEYVTVEKAYNCPNCNCTVWGKDKSKHCDNCGQALDRSEDNE